MSNINNQSNNIELKTKQNFSIKLSKMKQPSSQFNDFNINRNNLVLDKNIGQIPIISKNIWPGSKKQSQKRNRE